MQKNLLTTFKLINANLEKNSYLIINLKQPVSHFFKSVAFFASPGIKEFKICSQIIYNQENEVVCTRPAL